MGKKKSKDPQQPLQTDTVSPPSSIFNKLFSNAPEQSAATSLFSVDNPFRRKPAPLSDSTNRTQSPNDGAPAIPESVDEKKRKRHKEKTPALDSDPAEASQESEKKRKRGSDEGRDPNLGAEAIVKRKRKRDEVEKEWEEKKYGAAVEGGNEKEGIENKPVGSKRKALDDPADMMVSKEGFDDEDKLLRTVFVGNLPLKVKKKTLLKEFKKFGEVESVRIRSIPIQDTKKPRKGAILAKKINDDADRRAVKTPFIVHAYIVFKTEQSAQASLLHNMTLVEGNHIRVDRACPPRKKHKGESGLYDSKRTVFVGNLPFDVKDEELYQLFCGISNLESSIEAVRVVRDPHLNVGKGIAYVLFKTKRLICIIVIAITEEGYRAASGHYSFTVALSSSVSGQLTVLRSSVPYNQTSFYASLRNLLLEAAKFVVRKRNLKLRDRELRLSHAKADATPSKRPNSSSAQAPSTPAKKLSVASRSPSISNNRSNRKANASYQGLRATKSDVPKKIHGGEKPKERKSKRPTVAARKAKAKLAKESGVPKQAGVKRKLDSRTPDTTLRNKKAKKNRLYVPSTTRPS
ncbi:RNA-binding protein 34, partial [Mucuna pruriens]